jgi:DNA polymerase III subunit alpha
MWFPLCNFTHYSLLRGYSKPTELAQKCESNGFKACGIADYHSISGSVKFFKACKAVGVKPIIGCSFDKFKLFAKNKDGWFDLIKIVSSIKDGDVDSFVLSEACKRGNLISVADGEYFSPISGDDYYVKSELLRSSYYTNKEDADLHRVLLCTSLKTTLPKIASGAFKVPDDYSKFFEFSDYYVRSKEEYVELLLLNDENNNPLEEIYNKCEDYNILSGPILPSFPTPNGESERDYLRQLCRDGWRKYIAGRGVADTPETKKIYGDRFNREFETFAEADLFGYFLIVWDIIKFCNDNGWITGPGRGSAAGCLITYLLGITKIDPIEHGLIFERFYNAGRNTEDHISLPDIDMDVPASKRDEIIEYIKDTYGHHRVGQVITFGRLQGKSALKEVLRVHETCGFGEMTEITKSIPDESIISDQLQQMDEEDRSIIRWALLHNKTELMNYCHITDDGEFEGIYAPQFKQAIEIEGTYKSHGKHAAGVVISRDPLADVCPMIVDADGNTKAGLEMGDLGDLGQEKFDVLGLTHLDKIMRMKELVFERHGVDVSEFLS